LIVEGEKFPVHRSFLAANSDYFLSLFSSAEEQHNFVLAGVPIQGRMYCNRINRQHQRSCL